MNNKKFAVEKVKLYAGNHNGIVVQNGQATIEPKLSLIGLVQSWIANGFHVEKRSSKNKVEYIAWIPKD